MACDLTKGRALPCRESVGGIKAVYFVDFGDLGTISLTSDEVTDMDGTFSAFKYELKGASSVEQTINASRENGTVFFDQAVNLTLPQLSKEDNNELKLMAYGRPHIVVEDYNGNAYLVGRENGADVLVVLLLVVLQWVTYLDTLLHLTLWSVLLLTSLQEQLRVTHLRE